MNELDFYTRSFLADIEDDLSTLEDADPANDSRAIVEIQKSFDKAWRNVREIEAERGCDAGTIDPFHCELAAAYDEISRKYSALPPLKGSYLCALTTFQASPLPAKPVFRDLEDYILAFYDDPENGQKGAVDSFELESFAREELLRLSRSMELEYKRHIELSRSGWARSLSFLELYRRLAPAEKKGVYSLFAANPGHRSEFSALTFEAFDSLLQKGPDSSSSDALPDEAKDIAIIWRKTIHVGDLAATVGENSADTTRFATEINPVGTETVIITPSNKSEAAGALDLRFESINWTNPDDLRRINADPKMFRKPSCVYVYPADYNGAIPPTTQSIQAWARSANVQGDASPYFQTVSPSTTNKENPYVTAQCRLPADREYVVLVQAGARADPHNPSRLHPTDPYDNFDVTLSSPSFVVAADVSKSTAETLVLGEAFDTVTTRLPDGRAVPNGRTAGTANSAATGVPRLLGRAYAKYHPRAVDPTAANNVGTRTFQVEEGKEYEFSTFISGIDNGGKIVIHNGSDDIVVTFSGAFVDYNFPASDGRRFIDDLALGERTVFGQNGNSVVRKYQFLSDHEAVIERPAADSCEADSYASWTKYSVEQDDKGNWYVSEWAWSQKTNMEPFDFVRREAVEDEFDALQRIYAYTMGPMKKIDLSFVAQTGEITIEFVSYGDSTSCDELRFDAIRLTPR